MRHRRAPIRRLAGAAVAVVTAGCSADAGAALPPVPPSVTVVMHEYRFDHGPVPRGRVVFHVDNRGHVVHRMSLVPLPEDLPPIEEQLHGTDRRTLFTLAAVPDTQPGASGTVAVDLAPGRYAFICFLTDKDGQSHALKGMASEFRIR